MCKVKFSVQFKQFKIIKITTVQTNLIFNKNRCLSLHIFRSTKSRENSVPVEDDEDLDLWTIWGNLIKNWEMEIRKRPNYIKVSWFKKNFFFVCF